jgi:hypothetical protein
MPLCYRIRPRLEFAVKRAPHDVWVVGDEPWISIDYAGRRLFAMSPKADSDRVTSTGD